MELDLSIDSKSSNIETISLEEAFNDGLTVFQSKLETISKENIALLKKNLLNVF